MLLTVTTDKLSVITDYSGDIDVVATYIDRDQSTGAVGVSDRQLTNITTVTTTDILAAPGATTERKVQSISIRNAHASTSNDVTVQLDANGTLYELFSARLYPTEMLQWDLDNGFVHLRRRNLPLFARRLSEQLGLSISTVANSLNIGVVASIEVQPSDDSNLTRRIGVFGLGLSVGAASTTGVALGAVSFISSYDSAFLTTFGISVHSVTNATKCTNANTGLDTIDQAFTASPTVTPALNVVAGSYTFTETAGHQPHSVFLGLQTEIGGSAVTVSGGAVFEAFENTD